MMGSLMSRFFKLESGVNEDLKSCDDGVERDVDDEVLDSQSDGDGDLDGFVVDDDYVEVEESDLGDCDVEEVRVFVECF